MSYALDRRQPWPGCTGHGSGPVQDAELLGRDAAQRGVLSQLGDDGLGQVGAGRRPIVKEADAAELALYLVQRPDFPVPIVWAYSHTEVSCSGNVSSTSCMSMASPLA
jgi:hypothetical protein